MTVKYAAALAAGAILLSACASTLDQSLAFDSEADDTLLIYSFGPHMDLVEVEPKTGLVGDAELTLRDTISDDRTEITFWVSGLSDGIREKAIDQSILMKQALRSMMGVEQTQPGRYALYHSAWTGVSWGAYGATPVGGSHCLMSGAPVIELVPGKVNYLSGIQSAYERDLLGAGLSPADEAEQQAVIGDIVKKYPNITADVHIVRVVDVVEIAPHAEMDPDSDDWRKHCLVGDTFTSYLSRP